MGIFLLIALILATLVFFAGRLLVVYATRTTAAMVDDHHRDAEHIINTGSVPPAWLMRTRGKVIMPRRVMNKPAALRRLNRIIRYFERTPFVENDTVRKQLLHTLDDVFAVQDEIATARAEWQKKGGREASEFFRELESPGDS